MNADSRKKKRPADLASVRFKQAQKKRAAASAGASKPEPIPLAASISAAGPQSAPKSTTNTHPGPTSESAKSGNTPPAFQPKLFGRSPPAAPTGGALPKPLAEVNPFSTKSSDPHEKPGRQRNPFSLLKTLSNSQFASDSPSEESDVKVAESSSVCLAVPVDDPAVGPVSSKAGEHVINALRKSFATKSFSCPSIMLRNDTSTSLALVTTDFRQWKDVPSDDAESEKSDVEEEKLFDRMSDAEEEKLFDRMSDTEDGAFHLANAETDVPFQSDLNRATTQGSGNELHRDNDLKTANAARRIRPTAVENPGESKLLRILQGKNSVQFNSQIDVPNWLKAERAAKSNALPTTAQPTAGDDFNSPTGQPEPPSDWTIKTEVSVLSNTSFKWCSEATAADHAASLASHAQQQSSTGQSLHAFQRCLYHWIYPPAKPPPTHLAFMPKILGKLADNTPLEEHEKAELKHFLKSEEDWKKSFKSLYDSLRNAHSKYFYYINAEFSIVFFGDDQKNGRECEAIMSRSSPGIRQHLEHEDVSFEKIESNQKNPLRGLASPGVEESDNLDGGIEDTEMREKERAQPRLK
ncbi:hypothetical protein HK104_000447 [Borealophlyctis nickersoniae]|nr:hypothetical protein HK104_000447 [Borealophlyctis nickersoniae]